MRSCQKLCCNSMTCQESFCQVWNCVWVTSDSRISNTIHPCRAPSCRSNLPRVKCWYFHGSTTQRNWLCLAQYLNDGSFQAPHGKLTCVIRETFLYILHTGSSGLQNFPGVRMSHKAVEVIWAAAQWQAQSCSIYPLCCLYRAVDLYGEVSEAQHSRVIIQLSSYLMLLFVQCVLTWAAYCLLVHDKSFVYANLHANQE